MNAKKGINKLVKRRVSAFGLVSPFFLLAVLFAVLWKIVDKYTDIPYDTIIGVGSLLLLFSIIGLVWYIVRSSGKGPSSWRRTFKNIEPFPWGEVKKGKSSDKVN